MCHFVSWWQRNSGNKGTTMLFVTDDPVAIKNAILKGQMTMVGMELSMLNPTARKAYRAAIKDSKKVALKAERTNGYSKSEEDRRKHYEFCLKTFWKLFKKNSNKSAVWLKAATTK